MIRVKDVNSHYSYLKKQEVEILSEPISYPFGERQYSLKDHEGHVWTFSQSIADVDPKDWGGTPVNLW